MRYGILAFALLLAASSATQACNIRISLGIAQQTVQSEVVVVGTVTFIEREVADTKSHPEALDTLPYTVAIVKVETAIRGVKNITHIRVGFVPRAETQGRGFRQLGDSFIINLAENGRYVLFLQKHPVGNFYQFQSQTPPLPITDGDKREWAIAEATLAADAIADPMKALKLENAQDRALSALALLMHYRQPASRGEVDRVPIDEAENAAILKAIADGDWTLTFTAHTRLGSALQYLNIAATDGWNYPVVPAGANAEAVYRTAFQEWLAGPGAKFRIHKSVSKPKR